MKLQFLLLIVLFLFSLLLPAAFIYAGTLEWEALNAGNSEALYSDSSYSTKLAEGCFLQLILDVDGNGLTDISNTGSIQPTGDDILMPLTSGSNTGSIGANMAFDIPGHFQYSAGFSESSYAGKNVYVRFWNSASPGIGSAYGESSGYALADSTLPQVFNIVAAGSLYTDKTLGGGEERTQLTVRVYDADNNDNVSAPLIQIFRDSGQLIASGTANPYIVYLPGRHYYIRVQKQGYIFPSDKITATGSGDHGEVFRVKGTRQIIDIPIDRGNVLTISYAANKGQVVNGDIVTFNVSVENNSSLPQENIKLEISRMRGFNYIAGSAYLDNGAVTLTDSNSKYEFPVTDISGSGSANLSYQTIVSSGAVPGQYKSNSVCYRQGNNEQVSNSDQVKVLVTDDALMDRGTIIGKVFLDADGNGVQSNQTLETRNQINEPGVAGIKVYTEYGVSVITDEYGRYHIPDVPVGRHLVKVMESTLPENVMIQENPRWLTTTEGMLNNINFVLLPSEGKGIPEPSTQIEREEKYEEVVREVEEVGPDGRIVKKRIKEYIKTEVVREIEIVKEEPLPKLQQPEVALVKRGAEEPAVVKMKLLQDTFLVALAEGTIQKNAVGGNEDYYAEQDRALKEGWRANGRLAFTLLSTLFNKFDLLMSLDTERIRTAARKRLSWQKLMTNLSQDEYYPTYGDGSDVDFTATDTQDMVYARAAWDESEAKWGANKIELPLYQKAYHGGKVDYQSVGQTKFGRPWTEADGFYARDRQKSAHDEFIGTGGSLYYLKNDDIIEGSEMINVIVRDRLSDRVLATIPLKEQQDYEIDYLQGRILLTQPLSSVAGIQSSGLVSNDLLAGQKLILAADYLYYSEDLDQTSYGGRLAQNITDYVTVEGIYVKEEKAADPYKLYGAKTTLQFNENTIISGRYSRSEDTQLASGLSFDGGFNFTMNSDTWSNGHSGSEVDMQVQTLLFEKLNLNAGYTNTGNNFNATATQNRSGVESYYAGALMAITERINAGLKHYTQKANTGSFRALTTGNTDMHVTTATAGYICEKIDLGVELQHQEVDKPLSAYDYTGTLPLQDNDFLAARLGYKLNERFQPFIRGQGTLSGRANNQVTLGTDMKLREDIYATLAETVGNLGNATQFGLNKALNNGTTQYSNIELGRHMDLGRYVKSVSGQSAPINNRARIYMEEDYSSYQEKLIRGKVLGFVQELADNWQVGADYERSHYNDKDNLVNRDSGSVSASYLKLDFLKIFSKLELREDKKISSRLRQWVTQNKAQWYVTQSLSVLGRANLSTTREKEADYLMAKFSELGLGAAYRPVECDNLNILTKYSYITDRPPLERTTSDLLSNIRKHVMSVEGNFDINQYLGFVAKCAYRKQDEKTGIYDWLNSDTLLYLGRVNVYVAKKWNIATEYRTLANDQLNDNKSGWLLEIQRIVADNFQIGAGYNFTDFDDDLTNRDDYDARGWFVRVSAKY